MAYYNDLGAAAGVTGNTAGAVAAYQAKVAARVAAAEASPDFEGPPRDGVTPPMAPKAPVKVTRGLLRADFGDRVDVKAAVESTKEHAKAMQFANQGVGAQSGSKMPWIIGGAAVLGVAALFLFRKRGA